MAAVTTGSRGKVGILAGGAQLLNRDDKDVPGLDLGARHRRESRDLGPWASWAVVLLPRTLDKLYASGRKTLIGAWAVLFRIKGLRHCGALRYWLVELVMVIS